MTEQNDSRTRTRSSSTLDAHDPETTGETPAITMDVPEPGIDLPEQRHEAPDDEAAVTLADAPMDTFIAKSVESLSTSTTTIVLTPEAVEAVVAAETIPEPAPVIPALPTSEDSSPRRDRRAGRPAVDPEPASALTAERLVHRRAGKRVPPEGFFQRLVYEVTFHGVDLGDSLKARRRKEVDARIDRPLDGSTRFVAVLSRKGGVGKTTISTLLGMAMADVREDRVIAVDANPDRGTLAERITKQTRATVRDLVTQAPSISAFSEFQTRVSRDETRLDILASDTDPLIAEAFSEDDYNVVADLAQRFYSIVITDSGTGIVHSVMRATLQRADSIVIVSGGSVDEARLASETLTWLESNDYGDLVKGAVVALNTATQGTNLVKLDEIEAHFASRVREIVRIPYDPQLATGAAIDYHALRPFTKEAVRELAATVIDGLPDRDG